MYDIFLLGFNTLFPKNGLKFFPELLQKNSKILPRKSKILDFSPKIPKNSQKIA